MLAQAPALVEALLTASLQAAILVLLVWAIVRLAGAALPPRVRYALWCVVALRLALPFSLPDPMGLARPGLVSSWGEGALPEAERPHAAEDADEEAGQDPVASERPSQDARLVALGAGAARTVPAMADGVDVAARGPGRAALADPPGRDREHDRAHAGDAAGAVSREPPTAEPAASASSPFERILSMPGSAWGSLLAWVWLAGCVLVLAHTVRGELAFRRLLARSAVPITDPLLEECRRAIAPRQAVRMLSVPGLTMPGAWGILRPTLLVPAAAWPQVDAVTRRFVLRHELAHIAARDPAANLVLRLLAAVHWFNPLAWFALARLRDERELLRDAQALRAAPPLDADACAQALIDLTPRRCPAPTRPAMATFSWGRRSLIRERIDMILRERPYSAISTALGLFTCAVLGWLGLANATPSGAVSLQAGDPAHSAPSSSPAEEDAPEADQSVRVVRQAPMPAWETSLRAKLDQRVQWSEPRTPIELLDTLAGNTGIRFVVGEDLREPLTDVTPLAPARAPIRLELVLEILDWHTRQHHGVQVHWRLSGQDRIDLSDQALTSVDELRYYDVRSLLAAVHEPLDSHDHLQELLQRYVPGFDSEGRSIEYYKGRLLVRQSAQNHVRIERLFEQIARGIDPQHAELDAELLRRLSTPVVLDGVATRPAWIERLAREHGITVFVSELVAVDDEELRLQVDAPLGEVLGRLVEGHATVRENVVLLGHGIPLTTRILDVGDIVNPGREDTLRHARASYGDEPSPAELQQARVDLIDQQRDELQELVRQHVLPWSWDDLESASMDFWGDRLLVRQAEPGHAALRSFLDMTRRALR